MNEGIFVRVRGLLTRFLAKTISICLSVSSRLSKAQSCNSYSEKKISQKFLCGQSLGQIEEKAEKDIPYFFSFSTSPIAPSSQQQTEVLYMDDGQTDIKYVKRRQAQRREQTLCLRVIHIRVV